MARARIIKPETFNDEDLAALPPLARLLFIGLWTLADRAGRLEDRPGRIKVQLLPWDEVDVDELLCELARPRACSSGAFILRYVSSTGRKLIQIRNFDRHQHPHPREQESQLEAPPTVPAVEFHGEPCNYAASPGFSGTSRAASVAVPSVPSVAVPSAPSVAAAVPGVAGATPPPPPAGSTGQPRPPTASTDQADVSELDALAADVAQLRARATGRPTDAAAELLSASTTPRGRTFSRARDATPAWRAATRDRLLAARAELVEQLRGAAGGAPTATDVLPPGAPPPESHGSAIETWELVLAALRDQVSRGSWATWFRPTSGWSVEGGVLTVAVPTAQFAGWLSANYRAAVEEAVRQAGLTTTVRFVARSEAA